MFQRVKFRGAATGDIGFLWGTSLVSRVIEAGEQFAREGPQPPSHTFMIFDCVEPLEGLILEARWPRIALRPMKEYVLERTELFRPPVSIETKRAALNQLVQEFLGQPYGLHAMVGIAILEPLRRWGLSPRNWLARKDRDFCSELADEYLQRLELSTLIPTQTDPANLYNWLLDNSQTVC